MARPTFEEMMARNEAFIGPPEEYLGPKFGPKKLTLAQEREVDEHVDFMIWYNRIDRRQR